jgi:toxin HigB-1
VIRSFRCPDTERVFLDLPTHAFPPDIIRTAQRKLQYLDGAAAVGDLRSPPGNHLERLRGDRAGQWSIRINDRVPAEGGWCGFASPGRGSVPKP